MGQEDIDQICFRVGTMIQSALPRLIREELASEEYKRIRVEADRLSAASFDRDDKTQTFEFRLSVARILFAQQLGGHQDDIAFEFGKKIALQVRRAMQPAKKDTAPPQGARGDAGGPM